MSKFCDTTNDMNITHSAGPICKISMLVLNLRQHKYSPVNYMQAIDTTKPNLTCYSGVIELTLIK